MISSTTLKWIRSLANKAVRDEEGVFVAEGHKAIESLLPYFNCRLLLSTDMQWKEHPLKPSAQTEMELVPMKFIERASQQKTPQGMIAVFEKPNNTLPINDIKEDLYLVLDGIQNPGNVGTIIRLADWFGINTIFCSTDCADVFSPKTVQATMGSLGRVKVWYVDLVEFMGKHKVQLPVFGTLLKGASIFSLTPPTKGFIVLGSEGNGISPDVAALIDIAVTIPPFRQGFTTAESLNVATAAAIICATFRQSKN
ncbi:MAG: RNA methyltransferase [Microbacter sp.]